MEEIVRLWMVNTSACVAQFTQANFAKAVNTGLCKKNSCKNGGCCAVLSETHFQCLCARGFKGTSCEEAVSTLEEIAITLSNSYVTTVIAICSLVAAAFLYLSGKAVRRHRKRRRARYSRQLKAPKEPKTLSTETNL
ncbi:Pikachurin [Trichinella murrelli]|uniref:Pikachurin n=1 Tax=Trichinella murrelli TaxID=144512 RepID=A0A0V0T558_9BILA|nr:Pikachurin [Trichinella murrelli]